MNFLLNLKVGAVIDVSMYLIIVDPLSTQQLRTEGLFRFSNTALLLRCFFFLPPKMAKKELDSFLSLDTKINFTH